MFTEDIYNTNGGSGDLETSDFILSIQGGSAALKSNTPTSLTKISAQKYQAEIELNGTPNGGELLTIAPAANAIFDSKGLALEQDHGSLGSVYLKE